MKKYLLFLPIIMLSTSMSGCIVDDSWKKTYGTPELFLEQVTERDYCYLYTYSDQSANAPDTNLEVKKAILDAAPFNETSKTSSSEERYFTYHILRSHSTAGPNYCAMTIYDDGLMTIDYKSALGPHQYAHFTMDTNKATSIIDLVLAKIPYEKQIEEEDRAKAMEDGKIENFLVSLVIEEEINVLLTERDGESSRFYDFNDNGELLSTLKEVTFTPSDLYGFGNEIISYNYRDNENDPGLEWKLSFYEDRKTVSLVYQYIDRIGREESVTFHYDISEADLQRVYEKALELAKKL